MACFGRLVIPVHQWILKSNINAGSIIYAYYESKNIMLYMSFLDVTSVVVGNIVSGT